MTALQEYTALIKNAFRITAVTMLFAIQYAEQQEAAGHRQPDHWARVFVMNANQNVVTCTPVTVPTIATTSAKAYVHQAEQETTQHAHLTTTNATAMRFIYARVLA